MDNTIKKRLLIYAVLSGISFAYLILVPLVGIAMPIYAIIQLVLILYLVKDREEVKNKKALLLLIPVFILSLRYFLSGSYSFEVGNFFVIFLLYSSMILLMMDDLFIGSKSLLFIKKILCTLFKPLFYFFIPIKWYIESNKDNPSRILLKKILIGIVIAIPCLVVITFLLMAADLVFESKLDIIINSIEKFINPEIVFKIIVGALAGFYLFGLFYMVFEKKKENPVNNEGEIQKVMFKPQGDIVIINVVLFLILTIYTFFVIIQFKYLFAGATLPNGVTYAEYARRGFFELLFLSFINIGLILVSIYLAKDKIYNNISKSSKLIKVLMLYLCVITVMLLISSFYRMVLYNNEYGLTQLRLLVTIFLIFEAVGLIVTFYFIIKPRFNIIAFYSVVCLAFYITINMINLDYIIAKKNIDMYFEGKDLDVDYLYSLSSDAAPQMERLLSEKNFYIANTSNNYFNKIKSQVEYSRDWRSFNLSRYLASKY